MSKQDQEQFEFQFPFVPATPFRPILPKPPVINPGAPGNQIFGANCTGSAQQSQADRVVTITSDAANCTGVNGGVNQLQAGVLGSTCISGDSQGQRQCPVLDLAELRDVPFADLLALANAASVATVSSAPPEEINRRHVQCSSEGLFPVHVQLAPEEDTWMRGFHTPRKHRSTIPRENYDLNLPAGTKDAFSPAGISGFSPVTPDKTARAERKELSEVENVYIEDRTTEQRDEQANELAVAGVDVNGTECSKELQKPLTESSLATTPTKESHNSDNEGNHLVDLERTPQPKQRRKKHRPKVITEGKPRTRKPATPKPSNPQENTTGKRKYARKKLDNDTSVSPGEGNIDNSTRKRKYARKKGLNKDSMNPTEESGEGAVCPEILEQNKKTCRRALDFDMEGQEKGESSACKSACNLTSSSGTENLGKEGTQSEATMQLYVEIQVPAENIETGIAYEPNHTLNQNLRDYISLPENRAPGTPLPAKHDHPHRIQNTQSQKLNNRIGTDQAAAHVGLANGQPLLGSDAKLPRIPNDYNCSSSSGLQGGQTSELRTNNSNITEQADTSAANSYGSHYNNLGAYNMIQWMQFSKVQRRKRTDKGQNSATSSASSSIIAAKSLVPAEACVVENTEANFHHFTSNGVPADLEDSLKPLPNFNSSMASTQTDSLKKKRTRGATRVRDLASFNGFAQHKRHPICCSSQSPLDYDMQEVGNSNRPQTGIEALVTEMQATMAKKKRTRKRNSLINSACSSTSRGKMQKNLVSSNKTQLFAKLSGAPPEVLWEQLSSTDSLAEQLNRLDINRQDIPVSYQEQTALVPYDMSYQEHNALVLYEPRTLVPFVPIKKRRPRPKVDLDEETNRVWKLLLGNINSEGIDGTDEEKAKWWEEERKVFRGRADSFIARMHLVQGDRRFSPWKGSVVDSVIGVFLTQNVSDHLSSSAYMSLAARFPRKLKSNQQSYHQEVTRLANGEEFYVLEPEDTIKWDMKTSIQPVGDQSSINVNSSGHCEEKEVVNSKELSGSSTTVLSSVNVSKLEASADGLGTYSQSTLNRSNTEIFGSGTECFKGDEETNDALSSQNSVVSSENSVNFSLVQTAERTGSCSESNSEGGDQTKQPIYDILNNSTSFVQLLQMAGSARLHEVYGHQNWSTDMNSKFERSQFQNVQRENWNTPEDPKCFTGEATVPSVNFHSHLTLNSKVREIEHSEMFKEETRTSDAFKVMDENVIKGQTPLTEESACQPVNQEDSITCVQVALQSSSGNNPSSNNIQQDQPMVPHFQMGLLQEPTNLVESPAGAQNTEILRHVNMSKHSAEVVDITESSTTFDNQGNPKQKLQESNLYAHDSSTNKELNGMNAGTSKSKGRKAKKEKKHDFDWDDLRKQAEANGRKRERTEKTMDSLDWEAVRCADVNEIAETIKERGMNNMLAERIKDFLNRLVTDHGSIDLEWLRDVPPDKAKEYLLSVRGLGLKSVECVRLLTLHHLAFPVDTNVGRIAVRLGWVPLQPLPESLQLHLLELYPILESIQKYLWPRLCKLDQRTLYELHYQMITFGKVFCTKSKPNCNACPMRGECRHFASAFASARLALPGPEEKGIVSAAGNRTTEHDRVVIIDQESLPLLPTTEQPDPNSQSGINQRSLAKSGVDNCGPIIEEPASPEPESTQIAENDIEDMFFEDPDEIPTIKLNMEEFTQNLQNYMQNNMELQEVDMSKALVALTAEEASLPTPKLKNVSRLRTEHQVYELPDSHPLVRELDRREPDDPCKYLLAIWTPGETPNSIQPPERRCEFQEHGKLCDEMTCFSCNSIREAESQIVRGTLLIPCRTAMRGSFPLNGTYFQVNEVFADHDSSLNPIDVPREWLWNLPRRMVYFGTSIPSIFKGLTTEGIQHCFWRGYVCVRGFDQKTRAPRPLMARLHFPASKMTRTKGRGAGEDE